MFRDGVWSMRIQNVGNYDCQRKNDVNFKAVHLQDSASVFYLVAKRNSKAYVERNFFENPVKFVADLVWTVVNGAIGLLTKATNRL